MSDGSVLLNEVMNGKQDEGGFGSRRRRDGERKRAVQFGDDGESSQVSIPGTKSISTASSSRISGFVTSIISSDSTNRITSASSIFSSTATNPRSSSILSIPTSLQQTPLFKPTITSIPLPLQSSSQQTPLFKPTISTVLLPSQSTHRPLSIYKLTKSTSSSTLSATSKPTTPTLPTIPPEASQIILSITTPYPILATISAPSSSSSTISNTNTPPLALSQGQGLGPEPISAQNSSREGGLVAGVLIGVLVLAGFVVAWILKRYRRKRDHRRSYGGGGSGRDNKWMPAWGGGKSDEKIEHGEKGTRSLRTRNNSYSRKRSNSNRRGMGFNASVSARSKNVNPFSTPQNSAEEEAGTQITPPPPVFTFAPLRANRSSSVYSGSILNALPIGDEKFGGRDEKIEDFRRSRNSGEIMNRGRPISEGEKMAMKEEGVTMRGGGIQAYRISRDDSIWRDSELGSEFDTESRSSIDEEKRDSGKYLSNVYGYEYGQSEKFEEAGDEVSILSDEEEKYEEMRKGYKGRIRFGMGVQRRLTRESLFMNWDAGMV